MMAATSYLPKYVWLPDDAKLVETPNCKGSIYRPLLDSAVGLVRYCILYGDCKRVRRRRLSTHGGEDL